MMSFSLSGGVEVFGFISPSEPTDTYPVIDPIYGIDGLRNVDTLSDLDNIPELRRRAGMVVGVSGGTEYYKLNPPPWNLDFTDWSVFNSGGSGLSSYTYNNNTFTILDLTGGTYSATINEVTGLTVNGILSAMTYENLPIDVFVTGGTYSAGTSTFVNNTGGTFDVTGFYTGDTDDNTYITGFTYSANTFTISDNSGTTFNSTINEVTGLTVNGILSATTYENLPTDVYVTGGTYNNGTSTFTNNTGGTFNVNGFYTGATDVFVTGGTYNNGTSTFTNNTGGTFDVTGFYTGETDDNQYVTGFTYSANTFTISDNSGNTFNSTINDVTGLTVNGILSATTISGGTFYGNGLELTRVENLVTVGLNGTNCDFGSINSAVDYLISSGNTSSTNRYVITVGPGVFYENEIDLTNIPYVSIVGSSVQTTQILPNTNTQHIVKIGANNEISFLTFSGAPLGYSAIYCYDIGDYAQAHKISFYDCDINVWVESNSQDTKFYGEYLDYNGTYTYGTKVIGNNGYEALANMENYYNFPTGGNITYCNYATGSGATLSVFVGDNQSNGVSGSTAYFAQDGAGLYCSTITINGFTYGIRNPNVGDPIRFDIDNASIVGGEWDLYIERITTFGTFGGSANSQKTYSVSPDIYWAFLDIEDGQFDITRKASVTFTDGSHTDFTTLIFDGGPMGLLSGGTLTTVSGTTIQTDRGFGYVEKSDNSGIVRRINWDNSEITLSENTNTYIFINENGNLGGSGTRPNSFYNIILGRVVTNSTEVSFIDLTPFNAEHTSNRFGSLFREALGPIYSLGSIVTEGTPTYTLDVTDGEYYFSTTEILPSGGTGITFNQYYRNGSGGWITSGTTTVVNGYDDNSGTISPLPLSAYTKHTLYLVGDGIYENYFLVLGQNQYSTLIEAELGLLPTPPTYFTDSVVQVANIYIRQGSSGITQIEDIRPIIGFKSGGVNASSVHGNLLGLSADDHIQYLLVNGGRPMSGNLDMGTNNITNVGTVDGVTVSAHATRHQFGGLDPVGSTTPGPNYIPYADVSGTLNDWVSTASTTTFGKVITSSSSTTVVSDNDPRFLNSFTGGTYSGGTLSLNNNSGGTYNILGFYTGATDVFVTGGTYNNGTSTFTNNTGGTFNVSGFLSNATTAVTLSSNVLSVTSSGGTPTTTTINAATGGTYSNGTITLDGTGTLSTITGLYTGSTDVFVTGGTYSNGTSIFTNNTGGTFNVTGFLSTDTYVTGVTYSANTLTVQQNQGQSNITTTIGLNIKSNTITAGSFAGNPKKNTVTFTTAYPTDNYTIGITGSDNRTFTYESKTVNGFTINTNANTVLTGNVDWQTTQIGES